MSAAQVKWIRAALLCIGVVFIAIGLATGEAGIVLNKAIHICLECIGIG